MYKSITIQEVSDYFARLYPICRSIAGSGAKETLKILQEIVEFNIVKVPSRSIHYGWKIPDEWYIKDAYIKDSSGNRIIDFKRNNLHIVSNSIPINKKLPFTELKNHLYYLQNLPDAIPYRTSYYNKEWGFCLTYNQFKNLDMKSEYEVKIDSEFKKGHLLIGESIIRGETDKEYLFSSYYCHPSLANDNLSGIILWSLLLRELQNKSNKHTYRFVLAPETIGAIAYLNINKEKMKRIDGGFVLATVAGQNNFGYKPTYLGNHFIDNIVRNTFKEMQIEFKDYPFNIIGSDERQYSSPTFRIPIGTITMDKYYEYKEYHTSLDNLDFINVKNLIKIFDIYIRIINKLESRKTYISLHPDCEIFFNPYKLHPLVGASNSKTEILKAILNLTFWSDGKNSLFDISKKSNICIEELQKACQFLLKHDLIREN